MQYWTTALHQENQRFDAWCSKLTESGLPWQPSMLSGDGFHAEFKAIDIGRIYMMQNRLGAFSGMRERHQIESSHEPYFGVQLMISGSEEMSHAGERLALMPGSVFLNDSEQPISFSIPKEMTAISLRIPKGLFSQNLIGEPLQAYCVESHSGIGALLARFLLTLPDDVSHLDWAERQLLEGTIVSIVEAAFFPPSARHRPSSRSLTLSRVKFHINERLSDPGLSPSNVAADMGMSQRYMYQLFSEVGETFVTYVQRQRVEQIAMELRNPSFNTTITDCALRWGFNDSSHFSRVFKRLKGCTPRAFMTRWQKGSL